MSALPLAPAAIAIVPAASPLGAAEQPAKANAYPIPVIDDGRLIDGWCVFVHRRGVVGVGGLLLHRVAIAVGRIVVAIRAGIAGGLSGGQLDHGPCPQRQSDQAQQRNCPQIFASFLFRFLPLDAPALKQPPKLKPTIRRGGPGSGRSSPDRSRRSRSPA